MNPGVTYGRCFVDDFRVGTDSVFVDLLLVKRGCERFWIHASPLEAVSVMISEAASTLFSLNISKSTRATSSSKSTRRLWKVFRWWFPSRLRVPFCWLFQSQQGLRALPNPRVTLWSCFVDFFRVNRCFELFRIHTSPFEVVSLTFFFFIRFPSRHRLCFCDFF